MASDNVWHQVHAQREDGVAAMFLIRDVKPRADQPKIFVIELPYPVTDLSGQPDAAGYRRLGAFQEQWLEPACAALGWTFVAWKCEDGSFFLYLYGAGDPDALLEKLAPFDGELGFFNDLDADWSEYAALRELVEQAEADGADDDDDYEAYDGRIHGADHGHDREQSAGGIRVIDLTGGAAGDTPAVTSTADLPTIVGHNGKSTSAAAASEAEAKATRRSTRKASAKRAASQPAPGPASPATPRKPPRRAAAATKPGRDALAAAAKRSPKRAATVAGKPSKRAAAATASKRASDRAAPTRRSTSRRAGRR